MARKQHDGFFISEDPTSDFGEVLVLQSSWKDHYAEIIKAQNIPVLRLSQYAGWSDSDITFLEKVPSLVGVDIYSDKTIDLEPIRYLKGLRMIGLADCKPKGGLFEFGQFHRLQKVFLKKWNKAYTSIFNAVTLKRINVIDYPGVDLNCWKENENLTELQLWSNRLEALAGIERFPNLARLDLFRCRKLSALKEIANAPKLTEVAFGQCTRIHELSALAELTELKELRIEDCGDIVSLRPLLDCRKLEFVQVAGRTTIIDGDTGVLNKLPRLKKVLLANRKHYTHTADQLQARASLRGDLSEI